MPSAIDQDDAGSRAAEPAYLQLTLFDFTVINEFWGFYDHPDEEGPGREVPGHETVIASKWKHTSDSDRKSLNDDEDGRVWLQPTTNDRADRKQGRANRRSKVLNVYVMESVFSPLVAAIWRGNIETAILRLKIEPTTNELQLPLTFEDLRITHNRDKNSVEEIRPENDWRFVLGTFVFIFPAVGSVWSLYFGAKFLAALIVASAVDQAILATLATVAVVAVLIDAAREWNRRMHKTYPGGIP